MSHPIISKLLVETGAYRDLDTPVILTSGRIGIYYVNTEKLLQDGGKFNDYGDNSQQMIAHAMLVMNDNPSFGKVIDIMSAEIDSMFLSDDSKNARAISGGQRRDWLFSGPVAAMLGYPHISLYKDGRFYALSHDFSKDVSIGGYSAVHVSDLMTSGSSSYDSRETPPTGWIPMIRTGNARIHKLATVVSRLEGGEQALKKADVDVFSFVQIDEDFVRAQSKNTKALEYVKDPDGWSERFLREQGVEAFVNAFGPDAMKKDARALKFLKVYKNILDEDGGKKYNELSSKVKEKFGTDITQMGA
ncbi:MAG: hypothetical protein NT120_01040 [Candidatus Aenigmarchaeota archaeon]|nr:hypothetical protein [Candidatus Aenigmarchaeota archaeon]